MSFTQSVLEWIINNLLTEEQKDIHVFACKYPLRDWADKDKFRKDQEILEAKLALADADLELLTIVKRIAAGDAEAGAVTDWSTRRSAAVKKLEELLRSA